MTMAGHPAEAATGAAYERPSAPTVAMDRGAGQRSARPYGRYDRTCDAIRARVEAMLDAFKRGDFLRLGRAGLAGDPLLFPGGARGRCLQRARGRLSTLPIDGCRDGRSLGLRGSAGSAALEAGSRRHLVFEPVAAAQLRPAAGSGADQRTGCAARSARRCHRRRSGHAAGRLDINGDSFRPASRDSRDVQIRSPPLYVNPADGPRSKK